MEIILEYGGMMGEILYHKEVFNDDDLKKALKEVDTLTEDTLRNKPVKYGTILIQDIHHHKYIDLSHLKKMIEISEFLDSDNINLIKIELIKQEKFNHK